MNTPLNSEQYADVWSFQCEVLILSPTELSQRFNITHRLEGYKGQVMVGTERPNALTAMMQLEKGTCVNLLQFAFKAMREALDNEGLSDGIVYRMSAVPDKSYLGLDCPVNNITHLLLEHEMKELAP